MKIFSLITLVILIVALYSSSAQDDKKNNENFMEVQMLINRGLDDNFNQINEKSRDLTQIQKMFIYDDKKVTAGLPFVLNLFLGYGIGSWVQGHTVGGLIGTIGNLGGIIILVTAGGDESTASMGAILYLGTWLIDCILPFTYASSYNKQLNKSLGLSYISGLEIKPKLDLANNNHVIPGMAFQLNF
jgi:Borrelia membrane protein P13